MRVDEWKVPEHKPDGRPKFRQHGIQDVIRAAALLALVIAVLDERYRRVRGPSHMVIGADIIDGCPAASVRFRHSDETQKQNSRRAPA
jgi:hypothetical protein